MSERGEPAPAEITIVERAFRSELGIVAVWTAIGIVVMLAFVAFAVDYGNWYRQANRVQKAADAGSLGGVTFMPGNLTQATTIAKGLTAKNGFTDGSNATVLVEPGIRPTQLRVTITTTVKNAFASIFGVRTTTIKRTSVADYEGPVPMGSPENLLGNEPVGSDGTDVNDQDWNSSPQPQLWVNLAGPGNNKMNGDRYAPQYCSSGNAGCSGSTNLDFDPNNYFFTVRVDEVMAGKDLNVQVFDPAFVAVGDRCTMTTLNGASSVGGFPDASTRYAKNPGPFCTGDELVEGNPSAAAQGIQTTFLMRAPDETPWAMLDNPLITLSGCSPLTYPAYNGGSGFIANRLSTDAAFAAVFRRWVSICRIPANQVLVGDYVLQVRSNAQVSNPLAADPSNQMEGHNRFSIRAGFRNSNGSSPNGTTVRLFAAGRLPIYANADGADTRFYLARVMPGSENRYLRVSLFDTGDASDVGEITILNPAGSAFSTCIWSRSDGAALNTSGCTLKDVYSGNGFNGRAVDVDVAIPPGYTCDPRNPLDCWVAIKFKYPSTVTVSDTTTWSARMAGNPVRIVE